MQKHLLMYFIKVLIDIENKLMYYKKYGKENKKKFIDRNFIYSSRCWIIFTWYYFLATNNILKLGIISCAVYNKEYGFQFFDPFNMIFTREEKEKFGLE